MVPVRVGHGGGFATVQDVDDSGGGGGERRRRGLRAQTHQVGGEDDVRVVEQRVVLRWLGVEHVQPDAGDPAGEQRLVRRVVVDQGSTAAVDQDRSGFRQPQCLGVDQVVGVGGERQ